MKRFGFAHGPANRGHPVVTVWLVARGPLRWRPEHADPASIMIPQRFVQFAFAMALVVMLLVQELV